MTDDAKDSPQQGGRGSSVVIWCALAMFLYVLSTGPVILLLSATGAQGKSAGKVAEYVYYPIVVLYELSENGFFAQHWDQWRDFWESLAK